MILKENTIAAIATPVGEGGIAVIRVSGTDAIAIASKIFKGRTFLHSAQSHTAHFGEIHGNDESTIDEVVTTVFRAPHSYTGEDVVEISCHGGLFITQQILEVVLACGARMAEPGEFTKRAFLNGRMDLSQAEAVADLIRSCSSLSHRTSLRQLQGKLSGRITELRNQLLDICSLLEIELDFAEEGLEFSEKGKILSEIENIYRSIENLIGSFQAGRLYREGVRVVLAGKPNVGKSSILNALLSEERAIVTNFPGTTRDTIEESILINGLLFKVIDTAGLRQSIHPVEHEGIRRAEKQIKDADIILLILDISQGFTDEDEEVYNVNVSGKKSKHSKCLIVFNKIDLVKETNRFRLPQLLSGYDIVYLSAKYGTGLEELKRELFNSAVGEKIESNEHSITITNARHKEVLLNVEKSLMNAIRTIKDNKSNEFIAVDIREALDYLGEITGVVTTDEILSNIFSRFCIGK